MLLWRRERQPGLIELGFNRHESQRGGCQARQLLADGADAIDLGGQGSTDIATVVDWQQEWDRLAADRSVSRRSAWR